MKQTAGGDGVGSNEWRCATVRQAAMRRSPCGQRRTSWRRLLAAALGVAASGTQTALAQTSAQNLHTCSDVHAYCMQLCQNAKITPPPEWTCEANRCYGLKECLTTGQYKIGTQYGHPKSTRESYGPYEKR